MEIEGKIGVRKWQRLPKKIVVSKRISLPRPKEDKRTPYEMIATMWIMDAPVSVHPPGISLTLAHGKGMKRQYFRMVFPDVDKLWIWLIEFSEFILDNSDTMRSALEEAKEEWKRTWDKVIEAREGKTIIEPQKTQQNANNSVIEANKSEVPDGKDIGRQ